MAVFLKKKPENGTDPVPPQLRELLAEIQRERTAFQTLTERAEGSAERLTEPVQAAESSIDALGKRLGDLEKQMKAVETLVPQLAAAQEHTAALTRAQRRSETQLSNASESVDRIHQQMESIEHKLDTALTLKEELGQFLAMGEPFRAMRDDAESLAGRLSNLTEEMVVVRAQHDQIAREHAEATTRLDAVDTRYEEMTSGVATTHARVNSLENTLTNLSRIASGASNAKHQLATLKVLADSVNQKTAALDQQRESVDRAIRQAEHLNDLMRKIDAQIQKQEERGKALGHLRAAADELQLLHAQVLDRSEEITERQESIEKADTVVRAKLGSLRDEVQASVDAMEMEREGLDAVTQRIGDLRNDLAACEQRFDAIKASGDTFGELRGQAQALMSQVHAIAAEVDRLDEHADHIRTMRSDVDRLDQLVDDVAERTTRVESAQPAVEAMMDDLGELGRSHEAVRDALEQVRAAEEETARIREGQSGTNRWLVETQEAVTSLEAKIQELGALRPTVDMVRGEVERVAKGMSSIEARRGFVEDVHKRLSDMAKIGGELDERTRGIVSRLDAADDQFDTVATKAREVERIQKVVSEVAASVQDAEKRISSVDQAVTSVEGRSENLQDLAERMRTMGQELKHRQAGLEKASEHLDRVSALRQEAAAAVQELEGKHRVLSEALEAAESRAEQIAAVSEELQDRSTKLRFAEKQITQFEERITSWEETERQVARALDQVKERQTTIEALQADIKNLFDMSRRTVEHVRAIADARKDVETTRDMLQEALAGIGRVDETVGVLEDRTREIEHAEQRLARADGLLIDIQSSLDTLQGQKALVDHMVEKAGSLTFQTKHAEALIETLREEREIANKVRAAMGNDRDAEATADDATREVARTA